MREVVFPFGVDTLQDILLDLHVEALCAVVLRHGFDLCPGGLIFFVSDKGVSRLLGEHPHVEAVQRKAHQDQRQYKTDKQKEQHPPVLLTDFRISHSSSSFRITVIM